MALTVEDLYRQYAGREADPSGKAFWEAGFGSSIDANEIASFINSVAQVRAQGTEPVATPATTPASTATTSPEDAVNKIKNQIIAQGTTSQWSGQGLGSAEANAADMAKMLASAGITDINQFGKVPALEPVEKINTLYNGKTVYTETNGDGKTSSYIYEPTGKILTGSYGDGGDYTYPESRLVEVPKNAKLETVYGVARDNGEYGISYVPVDPSKIKTVDGKLVGDTGQTTFGNKITGQVVANNFETGSNAFGGTFAGKGKTGYRVQFAPDGTPVFYTGAESSSDIGQVMPFLQLALAASGAGGLLGSSLLGAGASEIASSALGNAILGGATQGLAGGNVLQGALLGGAGGALSGYLQGGTSALDAGMGVYPSTGNIGLGALDAGLGVYPSTGNIGSSALDAGMGVYPNTGNIGSSVLDAGFTPAGPPSGTGTFLGEGALSGIPASDAALANATVGATGLTMAQLAQLDLALGGAGGTVGAQNLAAALTSGTTVPTLTNLTGGSGLLSAAGSLTAGITPAQIRAIETGLPGAGLGAASLVGGAVPATGVTAAVPASGLPSSITTPLVGAGVNSLVNSILGGGTNLGNLLNTGLTTGAGLLQQQTSREAALAAQQRIDAETAAAKQAAAFRPIGMTTRFGTSQFQVDPVTGRLTSAGYTLSPEAKAQQDRLMGLSQQGLTQAEAAQQKFAPLQTGAQRLFGLGNQYLAQSPEAVAQNYLNQQMALLQPGRELELATLQNRLQQQGRGGLSVAQGGTAGATTPELQALYNARATQEAQLAAQAQQAGQQQVAFGAGLLGQGAGAMGQYYSGQQAAYAPYTTAMGQVQALEAAGQQPFTLSSQLGQAASTAGARAGALGLEGANISQRLATGAAATTNPYSTALSGATSNPAFAQLLGNLAGGLFSGTPQASLTTGFTPSSIAATEAGYPSLYY